MKRVFAALFFSLLPLQGFAKEQLRKFRHFHRPDSGTSKSPLLAVGDISRGVGAKSAEWLKGVGEFILREGQSVGLAHVAGTWKQTVVGAGGEITFSAGALRENIPAHLKFSPQDRELALGLEKALKELPALKAASRVFAPSLEAREESGEWRPYWRVEYLSPAGDRLHYALISREGRAIETGQLDWDGVDGRAAVFPKGPKLGGIQEEVLRDLTGDGTMSGRLLHVNSALNLNVWSPQLTFFFPENDRRFDLGQAYFTIDQGFRWLKDHLGVELNHPVSVRLHVGEGGVSNAAFYHQNTIYLGTGDGVIYKDMIRDPSILVHESIHALIDAYVGLPSEGEGGGLNEGFADLFAALVLDNPRMGEASYQKGPYRRTLENRLMAYRDFAPGVYQNGTIVGGTFWDMRPALGRELTAKLAFRTLVRLGKGGGFDDLPAAIASASEGLLDEEQTRSVMQVARARGWKVDR